MDHLADGPAISRTQLVHHLQVLGAKVQFELEANLERAQLVADAVALPLLRGGWRGFRLCEHQAFDIFALERFGLEARVFGHCGGGGGGGEWGWMDVISGGSKGLRGRAKTS